MYQARNNRVPRRTFGRSSVFVVLAMVVALLLAMSLAVGAAPPGSQRFSQTWGGGDAGDFFNDFNTFAQFGFSTDEFGNNMWINLDLWADTDYFCSYSGLVTGGTTTRRIKPSHLYWTSQVVLRWNVR